MKYKMSLKDEHFNEIIERKKKYEIRLNDLKRQKIKRFDTIIFKNIKTNCSIEVEVLEKKEYRNFIELYLSLKDESPWILKQRLEEFKKLLYKNYTKEKEKEYGVIAIKMKIKRGKN